MEIYIIENVSNRNVKKYLGFIYKNLGIWVVSADGVCNSEKLQTT